MTSPRTGRPTAIVLAVLCVTSAFVGCLGSDSGPSRQASGGADREEGDALEGNNTTVLNLTAPDFEGDLAVLVTLRFSGETDCLFSAGMSGVWPDVGEDASPRDSFGGWAREDGNDPRLEIVAMDGACT